MKSMFSQWQVSKKFLLFTFIGAMVCFSPLQRHVHAEGQSKLSKDFFDAVEPIKVKDPLAIVLGAMDSDAVFVFTYADAVKLAGHSCPAVAGAYKSTQLALKALYGEEIPVRGNIRVIFRGGVDYKVNGPISQVVTFITGASGETGFMGLGPNKKYGRYNLLSFDKEHGADPKSICTIIFQRADNGKKVEVAYSIENVPSSERIDKLMPLTISGKATGEESKEFGNLWQERVRTILVNPPEGTFAVKELKE